MSNSSILEHPGESSLPKNEPRAAITKSSKPAFLSSLMAIAGGHLSCVALAAITEVFYARLLGPTQRGLISIALMSVAFGTLIGSLGGEATIVVWSAREKNKASTWFPAVFVWITSGCLLAVGIWATVYWRWHPSFLKGLTPDLALIVLLTIPVAVLQNVTMALLKGEERFRLYSWMAILRQVASLVVFLILVLFVGRSAESASLGYLFSALIASSVAMVFLQHIVRDVWKVKEARDSFLPTLKFGVRGQAGNLASFFSYRLDVFVVNYFLDASQVGLYSLGVLLSEALWQIPGVVSVALCPRTARTVGDGADSFTCMILRQVFLVTSVLGILIALTCPFVIPLVFGARFAPSVPVIWWILPGTIALSLAKVMSADLTGRGLNIHAANSSYIGMVLTLGFDWYLIPRMGIQGAALASSIAYVAATIYLLIVIQRELKTTWANLLIPTSTEFAAYQRLWVVFRARFWPSSATAGGGV